MLIISRRSSAFKSIPLSTVRRVSSTAFTATEDGSRNSGKTSGKRFHRSERNIMMIWRKKDLQNAVTRRQMEFPDQSSSSPSPTVFTSRRTTETTLVRRRLPHRSSSLSVSLLLLLCSLLSIFSSCLTLGEESVRVRSRSQDYDDDNISPLLPSLEPCFPDSSLMGITAGPVRSDGKKKRPFGLPCPLSNSNMNYDQITTREEKVSSILNPLAFLIGPKLRIGIRSIQGLEYWLHAFHIPSPIRLIGKIILRFLSNSF